MQGQIRSYFEIEARELIDRLTRGALELSEQARVPEYVPQAAVVQPLERAAHTLKGASHVVGEVRLAALAHEFEDALTAFKTDANPTSAAALVSLADALAAELAQGTKPAPEPAPTAEKAAPLAEVARPVERRSRPRETAEVGSVLEQTVRVGLGETERLLEQIGESTRIAASLRRSVEQAGSSDAAEDGVPLGDHLDRLDRSLAELYRVGSQLRLIPLEDLLLEAGRMVRATAAALDREVICMTRGGHERVDVHVIERLESSLLHLVRNAVAHGIEPAAERLALGKPVPATVTIAISRTGSELQLTCADDGRGIDLERIRAAAVAQSMLPAEEAASATRADLLALLFRPGFSTAAQADQISGRGVGLDAVRSAIESVAGSVEIDSTLGQGTVFTLRVPQTLAAVMALEVLLGEQRFAIPLAAIEQTFLLGRQHKTVRGGVKVQLIDETETLLLGQDMLPVLRLSDAAITGSRRRAPAGRVQSKEAAWRSRSCLILTSSGQRVALDVDGLGGVGEVLARPLPDFLRASDVIAGAVLRADGMPMLLLDPAGLVRLARTQQARRQQEPGPPHDAAADSASAQARPDPILVIDDSLTTRMLEQSILEAAGYEVEIASSAEQGLELARERMARGLRYALFLVDVEMPGMNGFEFVRTVQADAGLRGTPAILVTSLDSTASRAEGMAAGAESYIVKGEFRQQVYLNRVSALAGPPASATLYAEMLDEVPR